MFFIDFVGLFVNLHGCSTENMTNTIEHRGVIERLDGTVAFVRIEQTSACAGCHVKSVCTVSDKKDKIIEAVVTEGVFDKGDVVTVVGQKSMGIQAVVLAYVLPFVLVVSTVFVLSRFVRSELIVGTCGLGILIPYFLFLKAFNGKIQARFRFYVVK